LVFNENIAKIQSFFFSPRLFFTFSLFFPEKTPLPSSYRDKCGLTRARLPLFALLSFFVPQSRCGKRIHESDGFKHQNQKCDFLKRIRISSFGCLIYAFGGFRKTRKKRK